MESKYPSFPEATESYQVRRRRVLIKASVVLRRHRVLPGQYRALQEARIKLQFCSKQWSFSPAIESPGQDRMLGERERVTVLIKVTIFLVTSELQGQDRTSGERNRVQILIWATVLLTSESPGQGKETKLQF